MARLIDGDALINTLQKLFDKREKEQMFTGSRGSCVTWNDAIYHIKSAPTVDAVPVVRAAWQSWEQDKPPFKWYSCNYCGFHALSRSNHCPNCGANMREV